MSTNSTWYMDVEDRVGTLIKAKTYADLSKIYPEIFYTFVGSVTTDKTYTHTVYVHELAGVESGRDIQNNGVNAYLCTFEVIVSVTEAKNASKGKKQECKEIAKYIVEAFKSLNFDVITMPTLSIVSGSYSIPMRFRRYIGADDTDILG